MKEIIVPKGESVKAIGPYNLAVRANGFLFTSGMLGLDPKTNKLVDGVEAQAKQALLNLTALLKEAGTSMENVVKATVFVQDLNDFAAVNNIYKDYFGTEFPARSCVQVAKLPQGAMVEIELIVAL